MADFIQPLDLKTILVNTLAGSVDIFVFLAIVVVAMGSAMFKMPDKIFIILLLLLMVMLQSSLELGGLYLLALVITSLVVFKGIARIVR